MERIIDEAQKNLTALKSLEAVISERQLGCAGLHTAMIKARSNFEGFEGLEGSLKLACDAFYVFVEQVRLNIP